MTSNYGKSTSETIDESGVLSCGPVMNFLKNIYVYTRFFFFDK